MPHRWNRITMYVRRAPELGDPSHPPPSLDPRDHEAIRAAIEGALGGLEVAEFSVFRIGEELPVDDGHSHAIIDHDVYSALIEVVKQLRAMLSDRSREEERVAAAILVQKALEKYQAACDASAKRPPHPQIEGPRWRHY